MTYDSWANEVEHELIETGLSGLDAVNVLDENSEWFKEQFDAGAFPIVTALEWFTHHHVE